MKVSVTQKASVAGAGRQMPSGGDTAGDYLLYQTPAEPAGLERGMEVSLGHTSAPLQQRTDCSNDGEYSFKLAQ